MARALSPTMSLGRPGRCTSPAEIIVVMPPLRPDSMKSIVRWRGVKSPNTGWQCESMRPGTTIPLPPQGRGQGEGWFPLTETSYGQILPPQRLVAHQGRHRPVEADEALLDDVGPVGQPRRELEILLGEQDRQALPLERGDLIPERAHDHRGQALRRLVEEEHPRVAHQGAGHREHLLLAAREAAGPARRQLPELGEELVDPGRAPGPLALLAHHEVLRHGQIAEDAPLLGHVAHPEPTDLVGRTAGDLAAVEADAAAGDLDQPHDRLERGRLAGPVAPEERDHLPRPRPQAHAVQDPGEAVAALYRVQLEHHASSPRYTRCTCASARTSAGRPSAMTRPWCSTMMRSATAKTTSMSCSVKSTVSPRVRAMRSVRAMSAPRSAGAMPAVGSSSRSTSGSLASATASSSFLRSP